MNSISFHFSNTDSTTESESESISVDYNCLSEDQGEFEDEPLICSEPSAEIGGKPNSDADELPTKKSSSRFLLLKPGEEPDVPGESYSIPEVKPPNIYWI